MITKEEFEQSIDEMLDLNQNDWEEIESEMQQLKNDLWNKINEAK